MGTKFKVHYIIVNGMDGSASVKFCRTGQLAEICDNFHQSSGDGWGESESFTDELEFDSYGILMNKDCVTEESLIEEMQEVIHQEMNNHLEKPNIELIKSCKQWIKDLQAA